MYKNKFEILKQGGSIYYTDYIVTNIKLPSNLVDNTSLGKFKLEHKLKHGYFVGSKFFCLILLKKLIKKAKGIMRDRLIVFHYVNLLKGKGLKLTSILICGKVNITYILITER